MDDEIKRKNLLKSVGELKEIADFPSLYLANYFMTMRNDVDKELVLKQVNIQNDEAKKNELNKMWLLIIEKIDSFEKNCMRKSYDDLNENIKRLNEIETKLNTKQSISLKEMEESIRDEETFLLENLFQNKTIFFVKSKTIDAIDSYTNYNSNDYYNSPSFLYESPWDLHLNETDMNSSMPRNYVQLNKKQEYITLLVNEKESGKFVLLNDQFICQKSIEKRKKDLHTIKNLDNQVMKIIQMEKKPPTQYIHEDFLNLNHLRSLYLNGNRIAEIRDLTFNGFNNLIELDLKDNQIKEIKMKAFNSLVNLQTLYLNFNKLTKIKDNTFSDSNSLHTLYLNNNAITEINDRTLMGLNNLQELWLCYNKLTKIESKTFISLTNLKKLILNNNKITELKDQAFTGLNNLQSLYLNSNQIKQINDETFSSLISLQDLWLSHNQITTIEGRPFRNLISLRKLLLNNNYITEINKQTFRGLINLKELWLSHNEIKEIEGPAFTSLISLQELYLCHNRLNKIAKTLLKLKYLFNLEIRFSDD